MALCFYGVIQEGLRNIAKHSKARQVRIELRVMGPDIVLTMIDDGIGFVLQGVREIPGIGLVSMRQRVDYINGKLSISSEPGKGTMIHLSAPLEGGSK